MDVPVYAGDDGRRDPAGELQKQKRISGGSRKILRRICFRRKCDPVSAANVGVRVQGYDTLHDSENHISRLLFKLAVEMDIVMNILAAEINASPEVVEKVRGRCIQNVKKTCGYISFRDAAEYQYRPPDAEDSDDE